MLQEGFELDTAPSSAQLNRQRRRETATKEKESQICQLFKTNPFLTFFNITLVSSFSMSRENWWSRQSGRYLKPKFFCRHRFDADPDPDPNICFDADLDPDPDRHQNDADPDADPTRSFTHVEKLEFFTNIHSRTSPHWHRSGSVSGKVMRIRPDPDPQHCLKLHQ